MEFRTARRVLKYLFLAVVLAVVLPLAWLRWESHQPRDEWFDERQGQLLSARTDPPALRDRQLSESVRVTSDSGLEVFFRILRPHDTSDRLPVLLVLGGHRTGSDAVDLFGNVGNRAVVGIDYPYAGPEKVKGAVAIARTIPPARQAMLDTVPAISLVIDWLTDQTWVDEERIIIIGASLGVPFAATSAARDQRISGVILVHGAVDTRLWLERQVERRIDAAVMHYPLSVVLYWLAYGPVLDTGRYIAEVSPRPVLIIGAREDERTPAGQTELLFDSAREPKRLRITDGAHIQPNRPTIIAELLAIAEEELPFLTQ